MAYALHRPGSRSAKMSVVILSATGLIFAALPGHPAVYELPRSMADKLVRVVVECLDDGEDGLGCTVGHYCGTTSSWDAGTEHYADLHTLSKGELGATPWKGNPSLLCAVNVEGGRANVDAQIGHRRFEDGVWTYLSRETRVLGRDGSVADPLAPTDSADEADDQPDEDGINYSIYPGYEGCRPSTGSDEPCPDVHHLPEAGRCLDAAGHVWIRPYGEAYAFFKGWPERSTLTLKLGSYNIGTGSHKVYWHAESGPLTPDGGFTAQWRSPAVDGDTDVHVKVTVKTGGYCATTTVVVPVTNQ